MIDWSKRSPEERATHHAYLLLEFGYVMGLINPTDPEFKDGEFIEAKKQKWLEENEEGYEEHT